MSSDREANAEIRADEDLTDPAALVSTMASAVERLRHMAATALGADAALSTTRRTTAGRSPLDGEAQRLQ